MGFSRFTLGSDSLIVCFGLNNGINRGYIYLFTPSLQTFSPQAQIKQQSSTNLSNLSWGADQDLDRFPASLPAASGLVKLTNQDQEEDQVFIYLYIEASLLICP